MKHLFLNLKRFDISPARGGVNRLAPMAEWAGTIVRESEPFLASCDVRAAEFVMFFPEAHLLGAAATLRERSPIQLGSQGVYRADTAVGGNFGAFTANLPANAAAELGCSWSLIGHCEERADKAGILLDGGVKDLSAVNRLLNAEIRAAQNAGLRVLYCIGEKSEEQPHWQEVLGEQLSVGLQGVDLSHVIIAYEPIWSIGPGKTPADAEYITKVARFIKSRCNVPVVYGGGLKAENARMLASIPEIDGGLIALTRFTGEFGFYPEEYCRIIETYLSK